MSANMQPGAADDDARWAALRARDAAADGTFVYSVKTTGVYCRPSCSARPARPENVAFHATPAHAARAGFRPCKRCKPDQPRPGAEPPLDTHGTAFQQHPRTEMSGLAVWDQLLCGRWSVVRLQRADGRLRFLALENPRSDDLCVLTPIERAVIERVASGQSNKVIAMELELHLSSVGNIIARAMRKLGIDRRVHVAALARLLARLQLPTPQVAWANAAANNPSITP